MILIVTSNKFKKNSTIWTLKFRIFLKKSDIFFNFNHFSWFVVVFSCNDNTDLNGTNVT